MDHRQLELDLEAEEKAPQVTGVPHQSAEIFCFESARKQKQKLVLNSVCREIIASVGHIEIDVLQYK